MLTPFRKLATVRLDLKECDWPGGRGGAEVVDSTNRAAIGA